VLLSDLHPCPRCECLVPREHNVRVFKRDHTYRALYCEFCGFGWEVEVWPNGDVYKLESSVAENPRHFDLFLARLSDAAFAESPHQATKRNTRSSISPSLVPSCLGGSIPVSCGGRR
jgi:hypothetical protein